MASALNQSASKMEDASSIDIEMQGNRATCGSTNGEDSTEHHQLATERHHPDIEEGPPVSSSEVPDLPEESGSQGNNEGSSLIANVKLTWYYNIIFLIVF